MGFDPVTSTARPIPDSGEICLTRSAHPYPRILNLTLFQKKKKLCFLFLIPQTVGLDSSQPVL